MGICSQPDKPKSDPVPSFIDISAVFSLKFLSLKQMMHLLSVPTAGSLLQVLMLQHSISNAATNNLRRDMMVARGVFSFVHEGWQKKKIPLIGIKKSVIVIKKLSAGSWQGEVNILGKLSHPNLVKLLGYCREKEVPLVYEFMQNGSLNYHLFGKCSIRPLPWDIRLKVAVGMAAGLLLLFRGVGNSQRSNPKKFLNADTFCLWSPMWSSFDCGFNWINPKSSTSIMQKYQILAWCQFFHLMIHVSKLVMGTNGYAAPEIMSAGSRAIDTKRPNGQKI
ncbi:hypothetical protein Peur_068776 [Populus x canadensis]